MIDSSDIQDLISELEVLDIKCALFKKGDFGFIATGLDEDGKVKTHKKQRDALKILTDKETEILVYGGAAGGAKSWTGAEWLFFMCILYPGTRWFIARNELKDIEESCFVTFGEVARRHGYNGYKHNSIKHWVRFDNGSQINFIEIKYKPSDPMFEDLGSIEYTGGWIEEAGEVNETGANVIMSRVGRWKNTQYGLKRKIFITCNPKKNWLYYDFYKPSLTNELPKTEKYIQAFLSDNPFISKEYVNGLMRLCQKDKIMRERLLNGNWDYEDDPNALCDYEMVEQIFSNDHVEQGMSYLTADIARLGSDKAVICVWRGWRMIYMEEHPVSKTTLLQTRIDLLRRKFMIPKNRCIADEDGIGGGVVDNCDIQGFVNNSRPLKERGVSKPSRGIGFKKVSPLETPTYRNLQVQCLYHLADKINEGGIWIMADIDNKTKQDIKDELDQIRSKLSDHGKLDCKPKSEIKSDLRRSPDYRDAIMMRVYFDLKPNKKSRMSGRPRVGI